MGVKEFSPLKAFESVANRWYFMAVLVFAGGIAGWLFQYVQPPVYESSVAFAISFDFNQAVHTQVLTNTVRTEPLTQYEEDLAVGAAQAIIGSTRIMEQVVSAAREQGIDIQLPDLARNYYIERRQNLNYLRVRHRNPETAAIIANLWGERAYAALLDAHQHALRLREIQTNLDVLRFCLLPASPNVVPSAICSELPASEISSRITGLEAELGIEMQSSQAILPSLVIELSQTAVVPDEPVAYRVNLLVLAGILIGFLSGIVLTTTLQR